MKATPVQLVLNLAGPECAVCGNALGRHQQLYCGPRCRRRSQAVTRNAWQQANRHRYLMDRTCERCGETYRVRYDRTTQRFCSRSCAHRTAGPPRPPWTPSYPGEEHPALRLGPLRQALAEGDAGRAIDLLLQRTIPEAGCLRWTGRCSPNGYPKLKVGRRTVGAHRLVLELTLGRVLGPDEPAHHRCGNAWCVRPEHLQAVTHADNNAEMLARRAYLSRIAALEAALAAVSPDHELLRHGG